MDKGVRWTYVRGSESRSGLEVEFSGVKSGKVGDFEREKEGF